MKIRRFLLTFFTVFFISAAVYSQSDIFLDETSVSETDSVNMPLPAGYGDIKLGMELADVEVKLFDNPNFAYRGSPDVTMLPQDDRQVIDCDGVMYVERGYFQFNDNKLYLMTMVLDTEYVDHYSVYSSFLKKYGQPLFLDPLKTVWEDESVRISLERPLSIKYIDKAVFEELQQERSAGESMEEMLRQDFLDSF